MPSLSYTCSIGNSNKDLKAGATITEYFSRSGSVPTQGARIDSATIHLSDIKTYTGRGIYLSISGLGTSETLSSNESGHSETVSFSVASSILDFASGSVQIAIHTQNSSTANQINFRAGCK